MRKKFDSMDDMDADDRNVVIELLDTKYNIKANDNWFMYFHNDNVVDYDKLPPVGHGKYVFDTVHRPDVSWCVDTAIGKQYYIIEIDGSVHNKYVTKTLRRNRDYDRCGDIVYFVINKEDCKTEKLDWFDELDKELNKVLL